MWNSRERRPPGKKRIPARGGTQTDNRNATGANARLNCDKMGFRYGYDDHGERAP